jgi:hypothetical protein
MLKLTLDLTRALSFVALAAALGACGSISGDGSSRFAPSSSTQSVIRLDKQAIFSTTTTVGDFICPKAFNTAPDYDYDLDGSKFYRICKHKSSANDVLVWGKTSKDKQVCVFPVEYVDRDHLYAKPDTSTGLPLVTCADNNEVSGLAMRFPGITFNALFIVEGADKAQMQSCLKQSNFYLCPHYTYGKFR